MMMPFPRRARQFFPSAAMLFRFLAVCLLNAEGVLMEGASSSDGLLDEDMPNPAVATPLLGTGDLLSNGSGEPPDPFDPLTRDNLQQARWWYLGSSVLAVLLCSSMVISYASADKRQRLPPANLLRNRTITDIGNSLAYIIPAIEGVHHSRTSCELQAVLIQFFATASLMWWMSFSLELLWSVRNPFTDHESHLKTYHALVWTLSTASAVALKASGEIGVTDLNFCWVATNASTPLSAITIYVPVAVCYVFSVIILVWVTLSQGVAIPASHQIRKVAISQSKWYLLFIGIYWTYSAVVWFWGFGSAESKALIGMWAGSIALRGIVAQFVWYKTSHVALKGYSETFVSEDTPNTTELAPHARVATEPLVDADDDLENAFLHRKSLTSDRTRVSLPGIRECKESVPLKWALRRDVMLACQQGIGAMAETSQESMLSLPASYKLQPSDFEASAVRQIERTDQDNVSFTFEDVAPLCFYAIRQSTGMTTEIYRSIFNYENVDDVMMEKFSDGGSSGSFFYFTAGREFIVKTITASEASLLKGLLPSYYQHLMSNPHSLVVRFYGLHSVKMHRGASKLNVVVMENVFLTRRAIDEVYDIKGSWIDRGPVERGRQRSRNSSTTTSGSDSESSSPDSPVSPSRGRTSAWLVKMNLKGLKGKGKKARAQKHVLKDLDLAGVKQVVVPEEVRRKLSEQAKRDCEWFIRHRIMDYSLLLGVHHGSYDDLRVPRDDLALDLTAPPDSVQSPLHHRTSRYPYQPPAPEESPVHERPPHVIPVYRRDEGGLFNAATREEEHGGDNMYFMGVIDILQQWTLQKKLERFFKVWFLRKDPNGVSAVDPDWYGKRFLQRFNETITSPERLAAAVAQRRADEAERDSAPPPPLSPDNTLRSNIGFRALATASHPTMSHMLGGSAPVESSDTPVIVSLGSSAPPSPLAPDRKKVFPSSKDSSPVYRPMSELMAYHHSPQEVALA